MTVDQKTIERAKKILALARDGSLGEQEAASLKLKQLLEAHGFTLEDLERELCTQATYIHWFSCRTVSERALLLQVKYKITNDAAGRHYRDGKRVGLDLTEVQAAEVRRLYDHYRPLLKSHLDDAFNAFIQANHLFGSPSDTIESEAEVMTLEDIKRLKRILGMARQIDVSAPYLQIED